MRFILFFIIALFSLSGEYLYAQSGMSFSGRVESRFTSSVDRIVEINQSLRKKSTQVIMEKLFSERETLTKYAKSLYRHLEFREDMRPAQDVSNRYRLVLQKYALSCEIAALRMIIESVTGKYTSEEKIIRAVPHLPGRMREGVWGDPDEEFVGSYQGSQRLLTGYGVHELPLQRYLSEVSIPSVISNILTGATISRDARLTRILSDLDDGYHILLWGDWCTLDRYEDGIVEKTDAYVASLFQIPARNRCYRDAPERIVYWKTGKGKEIRGLTGEHAFILLGYVGEKSSPTHIIVWDTNTGKHYYETAEWMRKWELMDYRTLIVGSKTPLEKK